MNKKQAIRKIKSIIKEWGSFHIGELESNESSPCVNSIGHIIALVESLNHDHIEIGVYDTSSFSCDPIAETFMCYEDLSKDSLLEILWLAEQYQVDQEKTFKRISN